MSLPDLFAEILEDLLGEKEYAAFAQALSEKRTWGLRVNTLKIGIGPYLERTPFSLEPVLWARDGFHHDGGAFPGRHPDYHAGLFYLQDPGAMLPAELLDPKPGERVLDLCAAPGGKSVQLAAMMRNSGLLVANDISPKRVKPLSRNLEGLGVACAVVLNETPERLVKAFPTYFDRILIDAPCSGEGMFRKDDKAARSWMKQGPQTFLPVQRSLLESAWRMLRPGGVLVYATCTFNPDENERNIAWALDRFPDMVVDRIPDNSNGPQPVFAVQSGETASSPPDGLHAGDTGGLQPGRPEWAGNRREMAEAYRIWPHLAKGEGQFAIRLRKEESSGSGTSSQDKDKDRKGSEFEAAGQVPDARRRFFQTAPVDAVHAWESFQDSEMTSGARLVASEVPLRNLRDIVQSGNLLFSLPGDGHFPAFLHAETPGLLLGEWQNGRFEPSAALIHALEPDAVSRRLDLPADSDAVRRYLHGETLILEGERGWTAVCVDGYPLGWGKQEDGFLKNRYPKGWRMQ
jgi:NOL1/NOP2/sun family putative RNA methylase